MAKSPAASLGSMMTGFWISQSIYVAAKLGIADLVKDAAKTADELAAATDTDAHALYRLLRALASVGIFREDESGRIALTPAAALLRGDVENSQRAMAIMLGEEHFAAWSELLYSVRTGKSAFEKIYGAGVFEWLAERPDKAAIFDAAMTSVHGRETAGLIDAYDFSTVNVLADVGGGNGSVLRAVLARHPHLRGMLCDLSHVIERAGPAIAEAGLENRLRTIATDFFAEVPSGANAYLMRHIIHDWDDERSLKILRNVRRAIRADGRLLVIESVVPPGNDPSSSKLMDLNMMVIPGGKERSESQYRELYEAAGFRLTRITPTLTDVSVIEGRPA